MRKIALFLSALLLCGAALAQQPYPNRPLRMVIPWPPGQATDLVARVVAQKLSEVLGQPVVAENRPGAGGMTGTDFAAKAPADGYTLLMGSSGPISINPLLQKTPFDVDKDLVPVAKSARAPFMLVTAPSFPAANAREFVALVKANPGKYSFASSGTGATAHILAEAFNAGAGLTVTHVPYKGSVPALTDVAGGQVHYALETVAAAMPLVRSGRLRAYGLSTGTATPLAPGVEPLAEAANIPGYNLSAWIGVMVAAGTPKPVIDRLSAAMQTVMQAPDVRERLNTVGLDVDYANAEDFARDLRDQKSRFTETIKRAGIKID
jgi:tripartite-type tricarboxylate transporter receptor subunit TctC